MSSSAALPATVTNIAWVLGLMGGMGTVGKFLDFYIGKFGREKVKDWLTGQWIKFDDARWQNFSEAEARYVVFLIDRILGAKLFSLKRLLATLCFALGSALVVLTLSLIKGMACRPEFTKIDVSVAITALLLITVAVATSFSVSRWLSLMAVRASRLAWLGPIPYLGLLLIHWTLLVYWKPAADILITLAAEFWFSLKISSSTADAISLWLGALRAYPHQYLQFLDHNWTPVYDVSGQVKKLFVGNIGALCTSYVIFGVVGLMGAIATTWRIVVALTYLAAFLIREWLSRLASTLWRRVCEDNDGAFTLVLGGLGAVAGGVKALLS